MQVHECTHAHDVSHRRSIAGDRRGAWDQCDPYRAPHDDGHKHLTTSARSSSHSESPRTTKQPNRALLTSPASRETSLEFAARCACVRACRRAGCVRAGAYGINYVNEYHSILRCCTLTAGRPSSTMTTTTNTTARQFITVNTNRPTHTHTHCCGHACVNANVTRNRSGNHRASIASSQHKTQSASRASAAVGDILWRGLRACVC